jgi:orotidine-5'-phosphate decarboxylase
MDVIRPEERLIVALDVPSYEQAMALVQRLGDSVWFYKIGLELFMTGRYFELLKELQALKKRVFVDLKLFDVPETVRLAVERLRETGADFVSVHGNDTILQAACSAKGNVKILAVTVLTSLDRTDLRDLGFDVDPHTLVLSRARKALALGCDGVVSSGLEASALRKEYGKGFLVVTPGIRPVDNRADDQKRVTTPEQAFRNGADFIVVGRPIRDAPDPVAAAQAIQRTIQSVQA